MVLNGNKEILYLLIKQAALSAIAAELEGVCGVPGARLLENPKQLDEVLAQCEKFNWEKIGRQLGQTRQQMYRWYHDTHQRKLFGSVSQEDVLVIRREVERAVERGLKMEQDFQRELKQKLSREYHRNSFTVAFNNQKRLVLTKGAGSRTASFQSASNDSRSVCSATPEPQQTDLFPDLFGEQNEFVVFDYLNL